MRGTIVALLFLGWPLSARGAFENPVTNPVQTAMGGSSLASLGDSSALFINPAATEGLPQPEAYFAYNQLYVGLNGVGSIGQGLISAGVPTRLGSLSLGIAQFTADELLEERTVGLAFAKRFGDFEAGVTGKYLYHSYLIGSDPSAGSDPTFQNGTGRGAFAFDGSVIVLLPQDLKFTMIARNINQPNVGLAAEDPVPRQFETGLVYESASNGLRVTADLMYQPDIAGGFLAQSTPSLGIEKRYGLIRFRAGVTPDQFSAGIGIELGNLGFDYTFVLTPDLIEDNYGSHTLGFRYRFGTQSAGGKSSP